MTPPDGDPQSATMRPGVAWHTSDAMAALAAVLAIASLVLSGWTPVARALVVASVLAAVPAATRGLRTLPGALALTIIVVWFVYGWLIGAVPPLADLGLVSQWLDSDARFIYPTVIVVAMCGLRRAEAFVVALTVGFWMIVAGVASGLVLALVTDAARSGGLVIGLSSSHHVQGALAASGLLLAVAMSTLTRGSFVRIGVGVLMAVGLAFSGSRAAALAAAAGCVLVLVVRHRHDRRTLGRAIAATFLVALLAVAAVPRVRTTVTDLTSRDFISDAVDVFRRQPSDEPTPVVRERASMNTLTRVGLWRRATDFAIESPLIGAGPFRFNDSVLDRAGVRWVAYPVTAARNAYNDAQAHNTYLHVLAETGTIGLTLYVAPWVGAGRRPRPPPLGSGLGTTRSPSDWLAEVRVASRAFIVGGATAGLVSESVFSPAIGVPVAIVAFGGATIWSGQRTDAGHHREDDPTRVDTR